MRTQQRDQGGLTTFSGPIADAAAGAGVAGGVSFTFTRTGTGVYAIKFDVRLMPTSVATNPTVTALAAQAGAQLPGSITVWLYTSTFAATNGNFTFSVTALDKRT